MSQLFDSLKSLITPEIMDKITSSIGEDKSKVTSAIGSIIPGLLGSLLAKGDSPDVAASLTDAGKSSGNILSNITGMLDGSSSGSVGPNFLNSILGDNLGTFSSVISSVSGMTSGGANKLIAMIAPIVASFLGSKMTASGGGLSGLLKQLGAEKDGFLSAIPAGLTNVFGVTSLSALGANTAKKGRGWLKWAIPILIIIIGIVCWRTCSHKAPDVSKAVEQTTTAISQGASSVAETVGNAVDKITEAFTLPNGTNINAFKGGMEDQMLSFLQSDKYKNATAESLKDNWFKFDEIEFVHGSATELTRESYPQIDNIVTILKAFKNVKVKIGAYTDKTGNEKDNLKLSQERANTVKKIFEKAGVGSQVAGAEGYGDQHAVYPADAPDSDRAKDRAIALRFVK